MTVALQRARRAADEERRAPCQVRLVLSMLCMMAKLAERPLIANVTPVAPEHLLGDLIQPGHPLFGLIWINPDRVSGAPCFYATRVPIQSLFDSLAAGETMEQFLEDFEGVSREQAEATLELAGDRLLNDLPKL